LNCGSKAAWRERGDHFYGARRLLSPPMRAARCANVMTFFLTNVDLQVDSEDATTLNGALSEGLHFSQDDLGFSPDEAC